MGSARFLLLHLFPSGSFRFLQFPSDASSSSLPPRIRFSGLTTNPSSPVRVCSPSDRSRRARFPLHSFSHLADARFDPLPQVTSFRMSSAPHPTEVGWFVSLSPLHVSFQRHPTFRSSSVQRLFGRLAVSSLPHHGFRPMRVPSPSLLAASGSLCLSCDWFRSPVPVRPGRLSLRSALPFDQADNRRNGHQFLRDL